MNRLVAGLLVRFLSSHAGSIVAAGVARYPALWRRVALKPVLPPVRPANVERLRMLVPQGGDLARLMYSMALAYAERSDQVDDLRALACLRTAEFLGFEGNERVNMHRIMLAERHAARQKAVGLRDGVESTQLTLAELANVDDQMALPNHVPACGHECRGDVVLLLGDSAVLRSHWYNQVRMVWVSPRGNGLTAQWLATLPVLFDEAVGDSVSLALTRSAVSMCAPLWITSQV